MSLFSTLKQLVKVVFTDSHFAPNGQPLIVIVECCQCTSQRAKRASHASHASQTCEACEADVRGMNKTCEACEALASHADVLRGSSRVPARGAGTRDEPLRTSAWEASEA